MSMETRLARVHDALAVGDGILPESVVQLANDVIQDLVERQELLGGRMVVALFGGTGSGKSSLFNALVGKDFQEVGVLRPTTRQAASATWGRPSGALLDYLGIGHELRLVVHDPSEVARSLDGLVLLDLPDQDSVEETHAEVVDLMLPVVDLIIWMVDPQKYADSILHENYLAPLRVRAQSMIVVINHADALTPEGLEVVRADVRRLLDQSGLGAVPVLTASVAKATDVDKIREQIVRAFSSSTVAAAAASSRLFFLANQLLGWCGAEEPELAGASEWAVETLVNSSGLQETERSIRRKRGRFFGGRVAAVRPPASAAVAAVHSAWSAQAKAGLPKVWAEEVDQAIPAGYTLESALAGTLGSLPTRFRRVRKADLLFALAFVLFGAALVTAYFGVMEDWAPMLLGGSVLLALMAVVFAALSRRVRRRAAEALAAEYALEAKWGIGRVVDKTLVKPTRAVLSRHRQLREALEDARG